MSERADVIVVGMGPGGEDVAERLAEAGLDVVGIDAELVGGECPYWGCVPSKMMIRAADLLAEARRVPGMAGTQPGASPTGPRWPAASARRPPTTGTTPWPSKRFEDKGGRLSGAGAAWRGPHRVAVGDRVIEADRAVVVNIGTRAWIPPVAGLADTPYWTNREAIETEEVPGDRWPCSGAGPSASSSPRCSAGSAPTVTVLEVGPRLVGPEEPESGDAAGRGVRRRGHRGPHRRRPSSRSTTTATGSPSPWPRGSRWWPTACSSPPDAGADLAQLNVASIGLDDSARALPVDDHLRVEGVEGLWAVGDVTGKGAFTHVSMYQADIVVNDILGHEVVPADYRAVPRVTFTDPEIGSVGLTERGARDQGLRGAGGDGRGPLVDPGLDPQGRATGGSSSWSRMPTGASWSVPRRWDPGAVRCSACSPWPSTPRCPPSRSGT